MRANDVAWSPQYVDAMMPTSGTYGYGNGMYKSALYAHNSVTGQPDALLGTFQEAQWTGGWAQAEGGELRWEH